jgi:Adenylate and Guanylate cyclase catalytic domain
LPNPRKDHAIVMAKFAMDCMTIMNQVTERLVLELGPDTNTLKLRIGLHSGPVVAGVLRGDKSRFQLFGETMTIANMMEASGIPNRIQVSQATADLLIADGKTSWLAQDTESVSIDGKGEVVTYFLGNLATSDTRSRFSDTSKDCTSQDFNRGAVGAEGFNRSTEWTTEVMTCLLKQIIMSRQVAATPRTPRAKLAVLERQVLKQNQNGNCTVIDEVKEIIELPDFQSKRTKTKTVRDVALDQKVVGELRDYIRTIALLYNANRKFSSDSGLRHVRILLAASCTVSRFGCCF